MVQKEFRNILVKTGLNVYHNYSNQDCGNYIVWQLLSIEPLYADDVCIDFVSKFKVFYFTNLEYDDENIRKIISVLNENNCGISKIKVEHDIDTGITMYVFEVSYE